MRVERLNIILWKKWRCIKKISYRLAFRTTAVLFDPLTDLLPSACGFGQQIRFRVKQNCCCPRTHSITVYYYWIPFHIRSYNNNYKIRVTVLGKIKKKYNILMLVFGMKWLKYILLLPCKTKSIKINVHSNIYTYSFPHNWAGAIKLRGFEYAQL